MENADKLLDDSPAMTAAAISSMKVSELRRELRSRGLAIAGNKPELVERLQAAISKGLESLESADEVNEDEVLGDVNLLSGDDAKTQEISEDEILGPSNTKDLESSLALLASKPKPVSVLKGKTPLVRSTSTNDSKPSEVLPAAKPEASLPIDATKENKSNVITIGKMSTEDRLALRAKKFNQPISAESKLKARSERFGVTLNKAVSPVKDKDKVVTTKTSSDMDKLKLRAQRFGQVVSTGLKLVEDKEKLLKRKQRFGTLTNSSTTTTTTTTTTAASSNNDDEKKKRRAERFGIS